MNEQNEFIKSINDMLELAYDQENVIFTNQLEEIFPEVKTDEAKKQVLLDYLKEKKIGLDHPVDAKDYMSVEEIDYLKYYMDDLDKEEKLSDGEREAYRKNAIAGDEDAMMLALKDYLPNVVDIARLYVGQGVMIEDLIGEANIALMTSLEGLGALDEASEVDGFFAKICMDTMQDVIAKEMDALSEEEKLVKEVNKVSKAAKDLALLLRRKVTIEELSEESKISRAKILKALKLTANQIEDIEIPDELK